MKLDINWNGVALLAVLVLGGLGALLLAPADQPTIRDAGLTLLGLAAGLLTRVGAIGRKTETP